MILDFNDESGPMHFEFIFDGFILGGSLVTQKGLSILRREMNILEKLESISVEFPCGKKLPTGEPSRKLNSDGDKKIHIDSPQFDILFNYVSTCPWQTGSPLKKALDTIDWLARSQKMAV